LSFFSFDLPQPHSTTVIITSTAAAIFDMFAIFASLSRAYQKAILYKSCLSHNIMTTLLSLFKQKNFFSRSPNMLKHQDSAPQERVHE
jgi:hypothetical protein